MCLEPESPAASLRRNNTKLFTSRTRRAQRSKAVCAVFFDTKPEHIDGQASSRSRLLRLSRERDYTLG
jgi:hypothetical protein